MLWLPAVKGIVFCEPFCGATVHYAWGRTGNRVPYYSMRQLNIQVKREWGDEYKNGFVLNSISAYYKGQEYLDEMQIAWNNVSC